MRCPSCPTTSLVMTERSGIEIDYCPDCRPASGSIGESSTRSSSVHRHHGHQRSCRHRSIR